MSAHTKGPWMAVGGGPLIVAMGQEEKAVVARVMCKEDIGSVFKWKCSSVADLENVANARLIASAPMMYEALKALYEHCAMVHKQWGEGCNLKQADAAIRAGQAAIAMAEGREI